MSVKTHYTRHYEGITSLFFIPCSSGNPFFQIPVRKCGDDSCLQEATVWQRSAFSSIPSLHFLYLLYIISRTVWRPSILIAPELNKLWHSLKLSPPELSVFFPFCSSSSSGAADLLLPCRSIWKKNILTRVAGNSPEPNSLCYFISPWRQPLTSLIDSGFNN